MVKLINNTYYYYDPPTHKYLKSNAVVKKYHKKYHNDPKYSTLK